MSLLWWDNMHLNGLTHNGTSDLYVYTQKSNASGTLFSVDGSTFALTDGSGGTLP